MPAPLIDRLIAIVIVLGLSLVIWLIASVFGCLLKAALGRLGALDGPKRLFIIARGLRPIGSSIEDFFKQAREAMEAADDGGSVRVAIDRRHAHLKNALRRAVQAVKRVSNTVSGLAGVSGPAEIGRQIGELDEQTKLVARQAVDIDHNPELNYAERSKANFNFALAVVIALACSLVNGGMLSTFFREILTTRVLGVPVAFPLAWLMVILEIGVGFIAASAVKRGGAAKVFWLVVVVLAALGLTSLEAVFFGIMSTNFDLALPLLDEHPILKLWLAPFGVVFVLISTSMGYLLHQYWEERANVQGGFSLARDLRKTKTFVESLPQRWEMISSKARAAEAAIDDFVTSLGSQSTAVSGSIQDIKSERDAVIDAIKAAKVDDWAKLVAGGRGDVRLASAQNIGVFLLSLAALVAYSIVVALFASHALSGFIPEPGGAALGLVASLAMFAIGHIAGDRLEIVQQTRGNRGHTYPLRPAPLAIVSASVIAAGVACGLAWIGFISSGWTGGAIGVFVFGLGGLLVIAGHFADRSIRGLLLVTTLSARFMIAALIAIWSFTLFVGCWLATFISWLALGLIAILAIPLELIIQWSRKPPPASQQPERVVA